jgi:hypothetical protein
MKSGRVISCFLCLVLLSTTAFTRSTLNFDDARMFDQYGNISWKEEQARLNNVAVQLRNEPRAVVHIIIYAGRRSCIGETKARALRAKNYLVKVDGISFGRVIWREGGYREDLNLEFWLIPREFPEPFTSPTLKPSDVQIKKCNRNRRGRS